MQCDDESIKVACIKNGRRQVMSVSDAYEAFWEASIGLLRPLLWLRHSVTRDARPVYLNRELDRTARRFTEELLMRGHNWLTIDEFCSILGVEAIRRNTFAASASRLNVLIGGSNQRTGTKAVDPPRPVEVHADGTDAPLRYRIMPEYSVFVIMEMSPESSVPTEQFDWQLFQSQHLTHSRHAAVLG